MAAAGEKLAQAKRGLTLLARFNCAGDEETEISAGNIVVVDAETKHRFEGVSDELSRVVSIHPSAEVIQENLS